MASTLSIVSLVRSCDVPGGMSTITKNVPVSSFGTRAVGVFAISHTSAAIDAATITADDTLWRMKKLAPFLYLLSWASYITLNQWWKRFTKLRFFPCSSVWGLRNTAQRAGDSVKALSAEKPMAIAMVIPNCW